MAADHSSHSAQLRQQKRKLRRTLSPRQQYKHAQQLVTQITRHPRYRNSKRIACYIANDGEINPAYIVKQAWQQRKQIYLPVLSPLKNSLMFAPYERHSVMAYNRFGIAEPDCHPKHWLKARDIDLILLPLVVFDEYGSRLGMGGGFYDRSLAHLAHRKHIRKPYLIGLAHELQKTDRLNSQSWDIPLDAIATEKRVYNVQSS